MCFTHEAEGKAASQREEPHCCEIFFPQKKKPETVALK